MQIRPRHALAEWFTLAPCSWTYNLQVVRSAVQLSSWHGAAVSARCHSACCWSNVAPSTAVPATRCSSLGDWAFAVTGPRAWNSLGPTWFCHLSPSRNVSRLIYLVYLFRARFDCVKHPCSSLGRLRRYNFVKLHYITCMKLACMWPKLRDFVWSVVFSAVMVCTGELHAVHVTSD